MNCKTKIALLITLLSTNVVAQDVSSVSFQNGVNGYTSTFDRRISSRDGDESDGADSADYFLDGFSASGNGSPDTQGLLRFDSIFGDDEGQIPVGATILEARLTLNTSLAGNAQTSGPYGVAGVLQPFDEFASYVDFEASLDTDLFSRGPWWQDNSATRPLAGFGFQVPGVADSADVTSIVQAWSDGSLDANGFVVQAGRSDVEADRANTSDGWSFRTTGFPIADTRPKLQVDYTTADVRISSFQDGSNGYESTTMAIVRSGANALIQDADDLLSPEVTEDGFDLGQTFLDGVRFDDVEGLTNSPDDFALIQFGDVFGAEEGQAPAGVPVAKAWVVITTGDENLNAHSSGPWSAHAMLRPWDFDSLHSSFDDTNGLQIEDDDIGPALDELDGFVRGSEIHFDVTEYLEGVRGGANDFGLAILTKKTADGWMIHATGSDDESARPRLIVYSADLDVENAATLDCNGDGVVDSGDLACVHLSSAPIASRDSVLATIPSLPGDFDGDGDVSFLDFLTLAGTFGADNASAPAYTDGNVDMIDGVTFSTS